MAADRISKETAELIALPPFDRETRSIKFLLNQPTVRDNIHKVPVNEPLMESLIEHGMTIPNTNHAELLSDCRKSKTESNAGDS